MGAVKKTLLQKANEAFKEKRYEQAYDLYMLAIQGSPHLENVVKFNLNMIKSKFGDYREGKPLNIVVINTNYKTKNLHITRAIYSAIKRHENVGVFVYSSYLTVVDECRQVKPDILLCIDGQRINRTIISNASRFSKSTVLWTFDDPYTTRDSLRSQDLFDIVFSNDDASVSLYGVAAYHLPLAAHLNDDFYINLNNSCEKKYDIFFCGTAWPNRVSTLNKLIEARPNLRYKISMPYNQFVPDEPLRNLPASSYIHSLNFSDFIITCKLSKIVLGLHRVFGENPNLQSSTTPGPRVFEVASTGAFQISDKDSGVEKFFDQETEIPTYSDFDELVSQVDYFLNSENVRNNYAKKCMDKVLEKHTYKNRLNDIFSKVKDNKFMAGVALNSLDFNKPKLLYCVHNTINSSSFGGLEIHQDVLSKNIKDRYEVLFLYSIKSPDNTGRRFILTDSEYRELESCKGNYNDYNSYLSDRSVEKWFSVVLKEFNISAVHFFHFINTVPSLCYIAQSQGVPYIVSVHDFFVGCRSFNLINHRDTYCGAEIETSKCDTCLSMKYGIKEGSQTIRRSFYREVLERSACIIYMSPSTKKIVESFYPGLKYHNYSRVHGAPLPMYSPEHYRPSVSKEVKSHNLRVVIPGNLALHKGGIYLIEAVRKMKDENIDFYFWGNMDANIERMLKEVIPDNVFFNGKYKQGGLPYHEYDVSLHLSIWPETYCQTLSEVWAARVVPICTAIGAFSDRVIDGENGVLVDYKKPESLAFALRDFSRNRNKIDLIRSNISDRLFISQSQHAAMYSEAYSHVLESYHFISSKPGFNEDDKDIEGYGLSEIQVLMRGVSWHNESRTHQEDVLIIPNDSNSSR